MNSLTENNAVQRDLNSLYTYKLTLEKTLSAGCRPEEFDKLRNLKHALHIVMQRILEHENTDNWSN